MSVGANASARERLCFDEQYNSDWWNIENFSCLRLAAGTSTDSVVRMVVQNRRAVPARDRGPAAAVPGQRGAGAPQRRRDCRPPHLLQPPATAGAAPQGGVAPAHRTSGAPSSALPPLPRSTSASPPPSPRPSSSPTDDSDTFDNIDMASFRDWRGGACGRSSLPSVHCWMNEAVPFARRSWGASRRCGRPSRRGCWRRTAPCRRCTPPGALRRRRLSAPHLRSLTAQQQHRGRNEI